jgi:hypothetical protein
VLCVLCVLCGARIITSSRFKGSAFRVAALCQSYRSTGSTAREDQCLGARHLVDIPHTLSSQGSMWLVQTTRLPPIPALQRHVKADVDPPVIAVPCALFLFDRKSRGVASSSDTGTEHWISGNGLCHRHTFIDSQSPLVNFSTIKKTSNS